MIKGSGEDARARTKFYLKRLCGTVAAYSSNHPLREQLPGGWHLCAAGPGQSPQPAAHAANSRCRAGQPGYPSAGCGMRLRGMPRQRLRARGAAGEKSPSSRCSARRKTPLLSFSARGKTPSSSFPARAGSGECPSGLLKARHVRPFQVLAKQPHTGLTASPVGQYVFNMRAYLMFIDRATIGIILLYVPVTRFNIIILHAILVFISRH